MDVITVVKFKVKEGFEGQFLDAINNYDYSRAVFWRIIGLDNNEYVTITEYNSIDDTGDDEVSGIEWLDSITHMLEYQGESRTQSYSGIVLSGDNNSSKYTNKIIFSRRAKMLFLLFSCSNIPPKLFGCVFNMGCFGMASSVS